MDGKKSSKLTGLISKLTAAANKAVSKKDESRKSSKRFDQSFNTTLKMVSLEKRISPA